MGVWLDLVRVLAALTVLVGHSVQLGLYEGYYPFTIAPQLNAVIVFFVLSGLVIASSAERTPSLRSYAIARISRIVPVAAAAIAVSVAVAALDGGAGASLAFAEDQRWNDPTLVGGAALFESEGYMPYFALNPPYWSLCYEVWFYALFGAATYLDGRRRTVWLALLAVAAGPNVLLLLPAWLTGVFLFRNERARRLPQQWARPALALAAAALAVVPQAAESLHGWVALAARWSLDHSRYALSDLLLAICVAAAFMGIRTLSDHGWVVPSAWHRPIRFFADMSFSLYLLHWPFLKLLVMYGVRAGESVVLLALILSAVVGASAAFAVLVEHRRGAIRAWLEAHAPRGSRDRPAGGPRPASP
jgi:peptidoglycan/LPS O-acetylase OafA/YrhL